jgi:NAD(P)-dependent dehydrogenase (short-subunit alcohol dehydrogenase family)
VIVTPVAASELFDLSGRVALVTGGATGIGWQMATALAEMGAAVALCGRSGDRCASAASELERQGTPSIGIGCDVSDPDAVQSMVDHVTAALGPLDVLVNNAGTAWGAPAERHPLDGWRKVIDVNLTGAFLCSRAAARGMLDRGAGKIVNVASVAGMRGALPGIRQAAAYSASKGGLIALTRDLAGAWGARGINVNAIAPGWFPSSMSKQVLADSERRIVESIPLGRVGGEHDLKGAAVFLSSAASDYVTGQVLVVDGGRTAI